MTVETMGKPRDMRAFRKRQTGRPGEVPTDIERRNQASADRNAARNRDDAGGGDHGPRRGPACGLLGGHVDGRVCPARDGVEDGR